VTWEFTNQLWAVGASRVQVETATLVSTTSISETPEITPISDANYETRLNLRLGGSSFEANYTAEKDALVGGLNVAVESTPLVTGTGRPGENMLFAFVNISVRSYVSSLRSDTKPHPAVFTSDSCGRKHDLRSFVRRRIWVVQYWVW
jgi:hypothetical protein